MLNNDFRDMLSALNDAAAEFLVVGAYALAAHGYPRATGDIDLWKPGLLYLRHLHYLAENHAGLIFRQVDPVEDGVQVDPQGKPTHFLVA